MSDIALRLALRSEVRHALRVAGRPAPVRVDAAHGYEDEWIDQAVGRLLDGQYAGASVGLLSANALISAAVLELIDKPVRPS